MNWNGRVKRIEEQVPAEPEEDAYTVQDFAREVIAAIDKRWLVDYEGKEFDWYQSPTIADNLTKEERSEASRLLHHSHDIVLWFAKKTGWRSPIGVASYQRWSDWRANNCDELRFIMELVVNAT